MAKDKKNTEASAQEETKSTKKAAESKKSGKKDAKKNGKGSEKRSVFQSIGKWFHDLKVEFKHVTWPTRQTVVTNTSVVLSVIVIGSIFIGLLDTGLLQLMKFLIGLSG